MTDGPSGTPPPTARLGAGPLTPLLAIVLVMVAALALREIASLVVPGPVRPVPRPRRVAAGRAARGPREPPRRRADRDAPRRARDRPRRGARRRVLDRGARAPGAPLRGPVPGPRHRRPGAARGLRRHGRPRGDRVGRVGEPGAVLAAARRVGRVRDRAGVARAHAHDGLRARRGQLASGTRRGDVRGRGQAPVGDRAVRRRPAEVPARPGAAGRVRGCAVGDPPVGPQRAVPAAVGVPRVRGVVHPQHRHVHRGRPAGDPRAARGRGRCRRSPSSSATR